MSPTAAYLNSQYLLTCFSAYTVGHLFETSSNDYRVAYFFCQFDNAESLRASIILSALVRQLLDIKTLPESVETCLVNLLKSPCPEAQDLGNLLKDVLVTTKYSSIVIDAIDNCSKSEWEVLLEVLRDVVVSCSGVVRIFLAVRQGIAKDVGKIFKSPYQITMSSSKVDLDIKTYIKDVLAEKRDSKKLVVGNPELINEISDALVCGANGMLVCHTVFPLRVLTEGGSFGWLSKLKIYAARFVTMIFAKQFENSQKIYQRRITASCQESIKREKQKLPKNLSLGSNCQAANAS